MSLLLKGLEAGYGSRPVLRGIDLALATGGAAAIVGLNGAGKTTLLRAISGLVRIAAGSVMLAGADIAGRSPEAIARLGVAHVPEGRGTFAGFSVDENLRLGAASRRQSADIAADIAAIYGTFPKLADRRAQRAGSLSGGEQQMLAIGRALMLRPKLLLIDEPSLGLAPRVVADLVAVLQAIRTERGLSILIVEQNPALVSGLVDEVHLLDQGRIVISRPPGDPALSAAIERAFVGLPAPL